MRSLSLPVVRLVVAASLFSLASCATQYDRHGRPIDPWRPLTLDTAPSAGPKPTVEQAVAALRASGNAGLATSRDATASIEVAFIKEIAYIRGRAASGWLVCYVATGMSPIGVNSRDERAAVVYMGTEGRFVADKDVFLNLCRVHAGKLE